MQDQDSQPLQLLLNFPSQPQFTFSNFVESTGSRFALATVREFVSNASPSYTSLFLSGAPGLGKTHLLMAAGNQAAESGIPALYVSCKKLVKLTEENETSDIQTGVSGILRAELLLMDDMDELMGHPTAQETLYGIYNTFLENKRRLFFAGRTAPQNFDDTEDFMRSRFKWGMTVELKDIDDSTTLQILKKLGQDISLDLPDAVLNFLMIRIARDFTSIKQAVSTINEVSLREKRKASIPLVKKALDLES